MIFKLLLLLLLIGSLNKEEEIGSKENIFTARVLSNYFILTIID